MRKEAKLLLGKAIDSLVLAVDHFNRAWDKGREETVLILLDRGFELLLKAAIVHKGGRIREPRAKETIGFGKCVRKCLTEEAVRCLDEDQAFTLQTINSLRDAAQHYLLDVSENQLYVYAQAGVTLFGDLLKRVFATRLSDHIPSRVLPVSTAPPRSFDEVVAADIEAIRDLVKPGSRRQLEAKAKLRPLAVIEDSLHGVRSQPSPGELHVLLRGIASGKNWQELFPGVASLRLATAGTGLDVSIRITKREGDPVYLVPEGTPGAETLAVKRVNELDYYSLGLEHLAEKLRLTPPRSLALIRAEGVQENPDYFKVVRIGSSQFKRYSPRALDYLKQVLPTVDMDAVWAQHRPRR